MQIIEYPGRLGKQKSRNAGMMSLAALVHVDQLEVAAEHILQDIEKKTPRGTEAFFRAVKRQAQRCPADLRKALFAVLVTR